MTAPLVVQTPALPPELEEGEGLVLRDARALVVSSDEDFNGGRDFLSDVILAGKQQVLNLFDGTDAAPGPCKVLDRAHKAMTALRYQHLAPWAEAERIVRRALDEYSVRREAERRRLEEERRREAERLAKEQADAEARRIQEEADREAVRLQAEAEKLRNAAAQAEDNGADADLLKREAAKLENEAVTVQTVAAETAAVVASEPVAIPLPSSGVGKLAGASTAWKCERENWNAVAFARWIAENPEERAQFIGEPAWSLLDPMAKAQKGNFRVGGITARPVGSARAKARKGGVL